MPDRRFGPGRFGPGRFGPGRWWAGCVIVMPGPPEPDREPDSEDTAGHVADALRYAKDGRYGGGVDWGDGRDVEVAQLAIVPGGDPTDLGAPPEWWAAAEEEATP